MKTLTDDERKARKEVRQAIMLSARERAEKGEIPNLAFKIDGTPYSTWNQCAIIVQNGNAGVYAGFRTWIDNGRKVKKGEHGFSIAAPVIKTFKDASGKVDHDEDELKGMSWTTIFHIEQTEAIEESKSECQHPSWHNNACDDCGKDVS